MGSTSGLLRSGVYGVRANLSDWSIPVFTQMPTRPSGPAVPSNVSASGALESIVVTWSKPTTHADGTLLKTGELAGFWLYWGDSPGIDPTDPSSYDGKEWINGERFTFTIPDPSSYIGPYYFAVQTVDTEGNVSALSGEVSASGNTQEALEPVVDDWATGNAESILVGRERIFIKFRLPKSSWVRFSHYNVYYDVDTGGGFSGSWTYLASEVVGFMHSPLNESYKYRYKITVVAEDGTETTGTIHDNSGAGYQPNEANQSNLLADVVAAQHIIATYDLTARTLIGGTLRSLNWGPSAGTEIDLDNATFKLGGSDSPKLSWDGTTLSITGNVTIQGGSGISNLSDAGALATLDVVGTAQIQDAAITTAKIGDLQVTGAKIANATITDAKIASLSADKITTGTLNASQVNVINLNANNITAGTLTGRTVRTASSGNRAILSPSTTKGHALIVFNSAGYATAWVTNQQVGVADASGNTKILIDGLNKTLGGFSSSDPARLLHTTGRFTYSGQRVFSQTCPISWDDLNLSSYIGSRRALVFLKVRPNTQAGDFKFRPNGDTDQYSYGMDFPHCSQCHVAAGECGTVWVMTDANGVIEWQANWQQSTYIWLLAYIT